MHTPGPRCTCTISNRSGAHQYEGELWQRIEFCPLHDAAREMLEALQGALVDHDPCEHNSGWCESARAAIAKARGDV